MLRSLHIENIAVIRRADIDFREGLSVLTGETGAGKSMIIDSINVLLGNRISKDMIRTGESRAVIGAVFEDLSPRTIEVLAELGFSCEDGTLMLQRAVTEDGRSQTRLNGQIITQAMQRVITPMLISIHGQMDSHKLLQKSAHLELLDAYAKPYDLLERYRERYTVYKDLQRKLESLSRDEAERLRLREMLEFQIRDIDAKKLRAGEEEEWIRERDRLLHAEKINRQAELAHRYLSGGEKSNAAALIGAARSTVLSLEGIVDGVLDIADRLSEIESEIVDLSEQIAGFTDEDREDPTARIDRIEGRLEKIARLKKKYGNSVEAVLAFRQRAAEQLEELELSEEGRERLETEAAQAKKEALALADELRSRRREAAKRIKDDVVEALCYLDMPSVVFEIRIDECDLHENGGDDVEFLIATNPGEPVQPLAKIASGGELSRIMLALRSVLDDRDGATTVVFDEIDTGVSGKTARKIGLKLQQTAHRAQVLCVTHSAQIASLADVHYLISKLEKDGRAETNVRELTDAERVEEIARILGGIEITSAQRDAAREMIEEYKRGRAE